MSVIENAIKRLQAAHGTGVPLPVGGFDGAALRREAPIDATQPTRIIPINQDALRAAGLLPPPHQERELAQQLRQIKRPLINQALGRGVKPVPHGNLLLVVSALPAEGKTFIAMNLALSMQLEEDLTVLLVDGDVVNPRLSQVLGADNEPGLLDVIKNPEIPLASVTLPTDIPGLGFLPAGRPDDKATELLASARMHQVMAQLAGHDPTRMVLFDSPPLLLTTESHALAHLVGHVLLVVRADQTPQHVVLEAIQAIAEDKPVSLVLNQCVRHPHGYYYYQYGSTVAAREKGSGE